MAQIRKHARLALGIVAAGTAGTAVLLGPASAAQAKSVNWDAVAQCESSGNWHINTGNGYHGGLQFSRATWKAYGGGKYASTANKATKAQQIAVAERVLKGQGIGAWPVCGHKSGSSVHKSARSAKSVSHRATVRHHKSVTHHKAASHKRVVTKAIRGGYVVKSGDTLSTIAAKHAVKGGWRTLYQHNKSTIGGDPNLIRPGQKLALR